MLSMPRGRGDLCVFVGGVKAALRQRRIVVSVNQIVQHARMLWLCLGDLFQNGAGLELFGVGLVAGQRRLVQRQRVEDGRLHVVRVLLHELLHRPLIGQPARSLIDLVVVLVVELDCGQPVALALGFGADRLALLHCLKAILQNRSGKRQDQRIGAMADRDAPVGDGALRIGRSGFGEC